MEKILFHNEGISFRLRHKKNIRSWIGRCILAEGKIPAEINLILCSDEHLLGINREFLKHDYYTDVITFDYSTGLYVGGDIFISLDRVRENASKMKSEIERELLRIMIHGILHLIGYQDKSKNNKQKMTRKEDQYIAQYYGSMITE